MHKDALGQQIVLGDAVASLTNGGPLPSIQIVTNITATKVVVNNTSAFTPSNIVVLTSNYIALGKGQELADAQQLHEAAIEKARLAMASGVQTNAKTRFFVIKTSTNAIKLELTYASEAERRKLFQEVLQKHNITLNSYSGNLLSKPSQLIRRGYSIHSSARRPVGSPLPTAWNQNDYYIEVKLHALTLKDCIEYEIDGLPSNEPVTIDEFNNITSIAHIKI